MVCPDNVRLYLPQKLRFAFMELKDKYTQLWDNLAF